MKMAREGRAEQPVELCRPTAAVATSMSSINTLRRPIRIFRAELRRRPAHAVGRRGHYRFVTIKPGAYPGQSSQRRASCAHIRFSCTGAHSFVSAAGDADVISPRDPLFPFRSDLQFGYRRKRRWNRHASAFDLENTSRIGAAVLRFNIVPARRNATRWRPSKCNRPSTGPYPLADRRVPISLRPDGRTQIRLERRVQ